MKSFPTTIATLGAIAILAAPAGAMFGGSTVKSAPATTAEKGGKGQGGKGQGGTGGKREKYGTQMLSCEDGNSVVYDGPLEMWPPNHKYRDLSVTATDDEPENTVTLTTTGTHNEYLGEGESEINGTGNTDDDFADVTPMGMASGQGSATTEHQIRGERSGHRDPDGNQSEDGRVYTIHAIATFSDGERCEGDFYAHVPHDQGKGAGGMGGGR